MQIPSSTGGAEGTCPRLHSQEELGNSFLTLSQTRVLCMGGPLIE